MGPGLIATVSLTSFYAQTFTNVTLFSALFTIEVFSELSSTLAGEYLARFSMSLSILYTCFTTEAASGYLFAMA
jgi:hypothetical protein